MNWRKFQKGGYNFLKQSHFKPSKITFRKRRSIFGVFKSKKFYITLLILACIAGLGYFFLFSPVFIINNIEIKGNQTINEQEMRSLIQSQLDSKRYIFLKQNNRFILNTNDLTKKISSKYTLSNVNVKVGIHKLTVNIEESLPSIVWKSNDKYYYLDLNGNIIKEILEKDLTASLSKDGSQTNTFPIIFDNSNRAVWIGKQIINTETVNFINNLNNELLNLDKIKISQYKVDQGWVDEVRLVTSEGWEAYFNIKDDYKSQLDNLIILLNDRLKDRKGLEYVDLRFGKRVYYK